MYSLKLQYNGNTVTSAGGSFVRFDYTKPYFVFEFENSAYTPNSSLYNEHYTGTWERVSSSPNQWKLEIDEYVDYIDGQTYLGVGLAMLFMRDNSMSALNKTCKLIGSGGFDYKDRNGNVCESMDRLFGNCTALTSISTIECTTVTNVNGMFRNCSNVESGALDQYNWFLNNGVNIVNHAGTFKECGASTQTGLAELEQIPFGWGGKLYPVATGMKATKENTSTSWKIATNNPTWTDVKNGMYMFTTVSVSRYEGVSMNRSRLYNKINAFSNATTVNEYYYPAFIQIPGIPGPSTTYQPTWIVTTETYNDMLQAGASNRDMAGTLDFEAYGQFIREYGTYDSNSDVHFVFLVTNTPIESWAGLTGEMAFLFNSNFNPGITLNWFFET